MATFLSLFPGLKTSPMADGGDEAGGHVAAVSPCCRVPACSSTAAHPPAFCRVTYFANWRPNCAAGAAAHRRWSLDIRHWVLRVTGAEGDLELLHTHHGPGAGGLLQLAVLLRVPGGLCCGGAGQLLAVAAGFCSAAGRGGPHCRTAAPAAAAPTHIAGTRQQHTEQHPHQPRHV